MSGRVDASHACPPSFNNSPSMSVSATGEIVFTVKIDGISNPLELLQLLCKANISESGSIAEVPRPPPPKKSTRRYTKERLAEMRSLKNDLLFKNLRDYLQRLNPDTFDPDMIDRTLERGEALRDIKRKYPNIVIYGPNSQDYKAEYRSYLTELGISDKKQQDLIISKMGSSYPYTDAEILTFVKAMKSNETIQI